MPEASLQVHAAPQCLINMQRMEKSVAELDGFGLSLVITCPVRKGLFLLILLTQVSAAPATSCGICAGPGQAGAKLQERMEQMTISSRSKGALARLAGVLLLQQSWLCLWRYAQNASGDVLKMQLLPGCWMGKG